MITEGDPPGVHIDDKGRDALWGPGKEDHRARYAAVGDPLLMARYPVPARDLLGPRLYGCSVGASLRLGEGEATDLLTPREIRDPSDFLLPGTMGQDGERSGASVYRKRHPDAGVSPTDLLDQQHVREEVHSATAVRLGDAPAHQPSLR